MYYRVMGKSEVLEGDEKGWQKYESGIFNAVFRINGREIKF